MNSLYIRRGIAGLVTGTLFALVIAPVGSLQATVVNEQCGFGRDLQLGAVGEDVRCLQRFLNANGYITGTPGYESGQFSWDTQQAVARWQASVGLSPTGYFGPYSRSRYTSMYGYTSGTSYQYQYGYSEQASALAEILQSRDDIQQLTDDLNRSGGSSSDRRDAQNRLDDARTTLVDALYAFLDKDYSRARDLAGNARDDVRNARDIWGGRSSNGNYYGNGDLTFAEANVYYDTTVVRYTYDRRDYVFTTSNSSQSRIADEIVDRIGDRYITRNEVSDELVVRTISRYSTSSDRNFNSSNTDREDAQDALDTAWSDYNDARTSISNSANRGRDVIDARSYLSDARDRLDDAQNALDDGNYTRAENYADDARDLVRRALNAVN